MVLYKNLIRIFLLAITISFSPTIICAQSTFNLELKLLDFVSLPELVVQYEDTIILVGHGTDYFEFYFYDGFIAKFNNKGELMSKKFIEGRHEDFYWTGSSNNVYDLDSVFVFLMNFFGYKAEIWVVNKKNLNINKKIKIYNGLMPDSFYSGKEICQVNDSLFAVVGSVKELTPINTKLEDIQVSLVNIRNIDIKHHYFGIPGKNDYPDAIQWNGIKLIIGSVGKKSLSYSDSENHAMIWEMDLEGNAVLKFMTPVDSLMHGIEEIVLDDHGNRIVASLKGFYYAQSSILGRYKWRPTVMQLDSNYYTDWKTPVGTLNYNSVNTICCLIPAVENDGYIAAGTISPFNYDEEDHPYFNAIQKGFLSKVDKNGKKMWDRIITVVDIDSLEYWHWIYDLEQSHDGGYIGCGDLISGVISGARSWFFKTDRHGCIVPGCHEEVSVMQLPPEEAHILIWPNPVRDWLYVFQKAEEQHIYHILDMNGRIIRRFEGSMADETLMIDVSGLKPGSYVLTVETASGKSGRKVFLMI